jgi:hypothetical protein
MDPEFIEPTPASRRRIALAFAATAAVAIVVIAFAVPRYFEQLRQLELCDQIDRMRTTLTVLLGAVGLLTAWMVAVGVRALRSLRWPPPRASVWRRTEVKRGAAARRYGWSMLVAGVAILAAVACLWVWTDRFYSEHRAHHCGNDARRA